jgi:hypothetical protein
MDTITFTGAIILQIALTFYYIFFIIRPLCEIEKISGKLNYGYRLLIFRTLGIAIVDILDYKFAVLLDIVLLCTLAFIITPSIKRDLNYVHGIDSKLAKYDEITDSDLSTHGIKSRKLLEETLFKKLTFIQIAKEKYDYDTLKRLCTPKMYNLFSAELRMVDLAELNYNYDDFKLLEMQIYDMESTEQELSIKAAIKVSCVFYRHTDNGQILDGSDSKRTIAVYEVKYTKNIESQDIKQNCPNCGAPTKTTTRGKCSYCNTIIAEEYSGWRVAEYKVVAETTVDKI